MKQFRIAIVGCGNISRMHFDAYLPHPERIQIVAACDTVPEHVQETQQKYGLAQGFSSLDEMIEGAEWEVAVVCTPTNEMSLFDRDNRSTPREQWENPYRGTNKPKASFTGLDQLLTAIEQGGEPVNSGRDNLRKMVLCSLHESLL